jgi:hypothetical protein
MEICSVCKSEFKSGKEYLDHKCKITGFKPTELKHRFASQANTIAKKEQYNVKSSKK